MSRDAVRRFMRTVGRESRVLAELDKALGQDDAAIAACLAAAEAAGFQFTAQDFAEEMRALQPSRD